MTHTNHRRGDRRSLEKDYIVLSMVDKNNALQCNYRESYEKRVKKLLEICCVQTDYWKMDLQILIIPPRVTGQERESIKRLF